MSNPPENFLFPTALKFTQDVLKTSGLVNKSTNPCSDIKKLDKIVSDLRNIITTTQVFEIYKETADRLEYWLNGEGGNYPFDINWLRSVINVQYCEQTNLDRFIKDASKSDRPLLSKVQTLEDGKTDEHHDWWIYDIKHPIPGTDFYFAVRKAKIISNGDFDLSRQGNIVHISGNVIHQFIDTSDFNPKDIFPAPVMKGVDNRIIITSEEVNLLRDCGKGAKDFTQNTCWKQELEAHVEIPTKKFRWNIKSTKQIDCQGLEEIN